MNCESFEEVSAFTHGRIPRSSGRGGGQFVVSGFVRNPFPWE